MNDIGALFVDSAIDALQYNKQLAEAAIVQLSDEQLRQPLAGDANSIAIIMKHIAGNLLSRWTDFLTTDGEKPWRGRDDEFVDSFSTRQEIEDYWQKGWKQTFTELQSLTKDDYHKTVVIRGEAHSAALAIQRSLGHTCYHVGQIMLIARTHAGDDWKMITIAKGKSEEYNRNNWGDAGQSPFAAM